MTERPTVLIVDNDVSTRESLRDLLDAEGYSAEAVSPGIAAQRHLKVQEKPCIVLLHRIRTQKQV